LAKHFGSADAGTFQIGLIAVLLGHHEAAATIFEVQKAELGRGPVVQIQRQPTGNVHHVGQSGDDDQEAVRIADGVIAVFDQAFHAQVRADQIAVDGPTRPRQRSAPQFVEVHQPVALLNDPHAACNRIGGVTKGQIAYRRAEKKRKQTQCGVCELHGETSQYKL
jgi:hypothetical protein